ncbi:MAG: PilN domain-containing protein [Thermoleophilia bacterium]
MKRINLLPPEQRVKSSRERGLLYAVLALMVLVLALGLIYLQQSSVASSKQNEVTQLEAEKAGLQRTIASLRPYSEIHNLRSSMTTTALSIYDARVPWSSILEEVSLVIPDNVRLTSLTGVVPENMRPGAGKDALAKKGATVDLTLVGATYSHKDVAEFMTRLGLIPRLTDIQLVTSTEGTTATDTSTTTTVTFTITASLRSYITTPPTTKAVATGAQQ